jgi:hypothetical protein
MVNERDNTNYNNDDLIVYLSAWPLVDSNGKTIDDGENWVEAYDLHAAAADIWEEKAAAVASQHDFSADNSSYSASQMYQMAMQQVKHHRAVQKAKAKRMPNVLSRVTYFPEYANPIYDEDEPLEDWSDSIVG